jgi:hypothetical protein
VTEFYRLSWEMVDMRSLHLFSNADPLYYKNTTQTVPNSKIPDEHWHPVSKETSDPWSQYNTLRSWAEADKQFVRNVRLERQVSEPRWEPVSEVTEALVERRADKAFTDRLATRMQEDAPLLDRLKDGE